jgi:hypothetical protein
MSESAVVARMRVVAATFTGRSSGGDAAADLPSQGADQNEAPDANRMEARQAGPDRHLLASAGQSGPQRLFETAGVG